jgi:acyl-CoA reductase-like NAD-dependent aldehyde dehydrogenase
VTPRPAHESIGLAAAAASVTANSSPAVRAQWMRASANRLDDHGEELVALAQLETQLPPARLTSELARTTFQLRFLAGESEGGDPFQATIDHPNADWPTGARPDLRRIGQPVGVVGVFGASNFPFAFSVAGGDTAAALAAGCSVVHKVHSDHERLGLRVAEVMRGALSRAGAPRDLLVPVTGRRAGKDVVDDPRVRAIAFTGSTRIGRALFDRAMRRAEPIPFYGELGSLNPVFVTDGAWNARRDTIIDEYVTSLTAGMGQFCTKPGILILPETDRALLVSALAERTRAIEFHPLLSKSIEANFYDAVYDVASVPAVDTLLSSSGSAGPGLTLLSTSADAILDNPAIAHREMFGPAGLIVVGARAEQYSNLSRAFGGQLTCGIHAEPGENVGDLISTLATQSGRVVWNGWPTGVSVTYAQQHGGPYPASTAPSTTSVGVAAIGRFLRPVTYQDVPDMLLPPGLRDSNPWSIRRRTDGLWGGPDLKRG